ncbi:Outer membrane receptor proteins, mostly Fe transport [Sphingomonas rubra]|uniref:Outer membrane receptor proteins, mostly Fe transport n=1 Tax=Sphingomonas rubra TaxID=634430 RepID=A0A1I5TMV0_9SPHN|nr:Outer membrane receptor proteins, mostly Fe transport [Sphingomonas rubra]
MKAHFGRTIRVLALTAVCPLALAAPAQAQTSSPADAAVPPGGVVATVPPSTGETTSGPTPASPAAGAAAAPVQAIPAPAAPAVAESDDIVVTARLRREGLLDVPIAVTALSAADISKYNAADLTKIGELTPTVIVSNYRTIGGGSIAIRGISSPPTQVGYEQPVSVAIDGIQSSSGRVATLGFFDVQQVEVLKGPQALFFGKNSPAGVISITTAGPTDTLQVGGRVGYEFVADEATSEGYIAGPITDTIGARVAVRVRNSEGWLYNNARPAANPFFPAALPAATGRLPGPPGRRVGDDEAMGRVTLEWRPDDAFTATAKVFALVGHDQGGGSFSQNIGPCSDGRPRSFGVVDPFGDCRPDNHTSFSNIVPAIADRIPALNGDNRSRGLNVATTASLVLKYDTDTINLSSLTGRIFNRYRSVSGLTHTVDNALTTYENTSYRAFSQELRLLTKLDGPVNFLVGAYYGDSKDDLYNDTNFRADISYNPANNRIETYEKVADLTGRTYSVFGQATWLIVPKLELAAGARYTREKKKTRNENLYGINSALGRFNTATTDFPGSTDPTPGILAGRFKDDNVSPEATLSYHPVPNSTIYLAYKTGFKSGGFGITSPIQTNTTLADIDFDSETAKGFEAGAKGELFDRRLRLTASAFAYDFKNLQVTQYDASTIRFQIDNAGAVRQRGAELEARFDATDHLRLHGAIAYVHNRFRDYTGQCYGYTIPAAVALTAAAPSGCSFVTTAAGGRQLTAAGTPILQQVLDGRAPARSPDLSGNAGFDLTVPTGSDLEFGLTGDTFYSSNYFASDAFAPASRQDDFWRFNASARVGAADGRWQLSFIGRNLSNKYYLLFAGDRTGGTSVPLTQGEQRGVVARGREFWLQASFRY